MSSAYSLPPQDHHFFILNRKNACSNTLLLSWKIQPICATVESFKRWDSTAPIGLPSSFKRSFNPVLTNLSYSIKYILYSCFQHILISYLYYTWTKKGRQNMLNNKRI